MQIAGAMDAEIRSFGEVLPQQSIGVLVGSPLPGTLRVAEVHLQTSVNCELCMLTHLRTLIPRQ